MATDEMQQHFFVAVPPGGLPGMLIHAQSPDGQLIQCKVPAGHGSGMQFAVRHSPAHPRGSLEINTKPPPEECGTEGSNVPLRLTVVGILGVLLGLIAFIVGIVGAAAKLPATECTVSSDPNLDVEDREELDIDGFVSYFAWSLAAPVLVAGVLTLIGAGVHLRGVFTKHRGLYHTSSVFYVLALVACVVPGCLFLYHVPGWLLSGPGGVNTEFAIKTSVHAICNDFKCIEEPECPSTTVVLGKNETSTTCKSITGSGNYCCRCGSGDYFDHTFVYLCENQRVYVCNHLQTVNSVLVAIACVTAVFTSIISCRNCCGCEGAWEDPGYGCTRSGMAPVPVGQPLVAEIIRRLPKE